MFTAIKAVVASFLKLPTGLPELPPGDHAHAEVRHAAPAFLSYRLVGLFLPNLLWAGSASVGLFAGAMKEPGVLAGLIPLALVLGFTLAFGFVVIRLDYELRTYLITDRSLRVREGALQVRELTLSYVNVQNVTLEQGPLERLFGFANVVVETAGGGTQVQQAGSTGHRAVLRGLTDAEAVRDLIRARLLSVHKTAGLGDADDAHAEGGALNVKQLIEVRDAARALAAALEKRTA